MEGNEKKWHFCRKTKKTLQKYFNLLNAKNVIHILSCEFLLVLKFPEFHVIVKGVLKYFHIFNFTIKTSENKIKSHPHNVFPQVFDNELLCDFSEEAEH